MKKISILLFFICSICLQLSSQHYTVIVSLDGFRHDYPQEYNTPNIDLIGTKGVQSTMRPSYPSSTFPNHYTLITGLVPDHHGIVNNSFWDRENKVQYAINDSATRYNPHYYKGNTIWSTAEKQGVKTGSLYWIGSDIAINNMYPTYYKTWSDNRLSFEQRVDTVLAWLNKPVESRPQLITMYIEEPDGTGHRSGPLSDDTKQTVNYVDSLIGKLWSGIQKLPIADKVNLIVTSDHGMTDVSPERFVKIGDHLTRDMFIRAVGSNPTSIFAEEDKIDSIYNILSNVDHISVYRKNDIPKELNYGTNPNIGDLIVVADLGWQFGVQPYKMKGAHGYPVKNEDMHVIFRAVGPDFKKGFKGQTFDNTAIYSLLCYLLKIKPAQTDGNVEQVMQFINVEK